MRTSEAARYARWAAATATVLALIAAGVYAWRQWQARQSQKDAPPVVPQTVQRQSEEFSFSKVEGERTLFTVRASQLTELREGGKSLLEDVWITIYGRSGLRFDNIHASKCDYLPAQGAIGCAGDVQIDLESAAEAKERPGQRAIRIRTSNISFDRETGRARTDQPVEFQFEFGHGRGTGMSYNTEEAVVRLERDVRTTLTSAAGGRPMREPLALSAAAMEYRRDSRTMRLLGPVRARQGLRELTAQAMALEFDQQMRAQRLVANGANGDARPQLKWIEADNSRQQLAADEFVARFANDGRVTQLRAQGNVLGTARRGGREDGLTAQTVVIEMDARGEPQALLARGEVRVESQAGPRQQRLETEALRLELAAGRGAGGRSLSRGQTLAPAVVELREGEDVTRLRAAQLESDFGARNRLDKLIGTGGVEIVRRAGHGPEQRTSSDEFAVTFGGRGQWTEATQSGNVRFREGERVAEAGRARMVRATDTLVMEGPATVADSLTRTTAAKIEFNQRTSEALATGNVRTSYLQPGTERRTDTEDA
ncbi:MAG: LPS export ABC transporter periplasmic protein LptC, partial [Candidatus Acidiferrales bacterium]